MFHVSRSQVIGDFLLISIVGRSHTVIGTYPTYVRRKGKRKITEIKTDGRRRGV
jgi:hypothetical protein